MQKLRTVSSAVVASRQVGAIEACYIISDVDLVQSSRSTININTLKDSKLANPIVITTEAALNQMNGHDSVVIDTSSQGGTHRHAYGILHKYQKTMFPESANFTFYEFLSNFHVKEINEEEENKKKIKTPGPYEIKIRPNGFISNAKTFVYGGYRFAAMKKRVILNISPYIPFDPNNEKSAFSTLLLYSDWGLNGESGILHAEVDAVTRLKNAYDTLPDYVQRSIRAIQRSEQVLADSGDRSTAGMVTLEEAGENFDDMFIDEHFEDVDAINNPYTGVQETVMGDAVIKEVKYSTDVGTMSYLYNFISNIQIKLRTDSTTQLTYEEQLQQFADKEKMFPISDAEAKEQLLYDKYLSKFSDDQMAVFTTFRDAVANRASKQVVMVLTGEGGTGKSDVIHAIRLQTQLIVGKVAGYRGACVNMAPTGAAAFNIHGNTWQSCLKKGYQAYTGKTSISSQDQHSLEQAYCGTRVIVLDEFSLLGFESLVEISERYAV